MDSASAFSTSGPRCWRSDIAGRRQSLPATRRFPGRPRSCPLPDMRSARRWSWDRQPATEGDDQTVQRTVSSFGPNRAASAVGCEADSDGDAAQTTHGTDRAGGSAGSAGCAGAGGADGCADSASAGVVASSAAETSTQFVCALAAARPDAAVAGRHRGRDRNG
jgi:hypothetical protein